MILDTIQTVLNHKINHRVYAMSPLALVIEAVQAMCSNDIGSVLVMDGARLDGVLTERGILKRVIEARLDPAVTMVAEVMSTDYVCVSGSTLVDEAMALMVKRRLRHLPVLANRSVVGVLSSGDLTRWILKQQDEQVNSAIRAVRTLATANRRGGYP
jgi:CBS domain-containing protein